MSRWPECDGMLCWRHTAAISPHRKQQQQQQQVAVLHWTLELTGSARQRRWQTWLMFRLSFQRHGVISRDSTSPLAAGNQIVKYGLTCMFTLLLKVTVHQTDMYIGRYTVFHNLMFFHNSLKWWSIYTKFLPVVAEEILIQNIATKCGSWLNTLC